MGYRSEIAIVTSTKTFNSAPDEVKESFKHLFGSELSNEADIIVFKSDCIKWYEEYPEVKAIENWLKLLEYEEYGYIRLGEDTSDVEYQGSPGDWGINHISRLEID